MRSETDHLDSELHDLMTQLQGASAPPGGPVHVHHRVAQRARRRRVATAVPVFVLLVGLGGMAVNLGGDQDPGTVLVATDVVSAPTIAPTLAAPAATATSTKTAVPTTPTPPLTATPKPAPTRTAAIAVQWNASDDSPEVPDRWEFGLAPSAACDQPDGDYQGGDNQGGGYQLTATTGRDSSAGSGLSNETTINASPGCTYDISLDNGAGWRFLETPIATEQPDGSLRWQVTLVDDEFPIPASALHPVHVTVDWDGQGNESTTVPFAFTVSFQSQECPSDNGADLTTIITYGERSGSATNTVSLSSPIDWRCVWTVALELDFEEGWTMASNELGEPQSSQYQIAPTGGPSSVNFSVVAKQPLPPETDG